MHANSEQKLPQIRRDLSEHVYIVSWYMYRALNRSVQRQIRVQSESV